MRKTHKDQSAGGGPGGRCSPNDPEVMEVREEAEADLEDAVALARTPGGGAMAVWHAGQAAEKYLRALARTAGRSVPVRLDVKGVFEAVQDLEGVADLAGPVESLAGVLKTSGETLSPQCLATAIESARAVRRVVLKAFGVEVAPAEPLSLSAPRPEDTGGAERPRGPRSAGQGPKAPRMRDGRSEAERRTSYVRVFLMCERCGVRIPRTQQTARGRVPCPLCGQAMVLAS